MLIFFQIDPTKPVGSFFRRSTPREPPTFKIGKNETPRKRRFQYKPWWLYRFPKYAAFNVTYLMISLLGDR